MLALSALATIVALVIAGALIAGVLGRFVTQGIDRRLDANLALMASAVSRNGDIDWQRLATVQASLDAEPGWRWRLDAPGRAIGSADTLVIDPGPAESRRSSPFPPDREHPGSAGPPHADDHGARPLEGHDRAGAPIHARQTTMVTGTGPVVLTAAAPRDVIARPVMSALTPLLATLAALGTVLGLAAWLQIRLGLRPIRRLRAVIEQVRRGEADAIDTDQPVELRALAEELNALVHDNDMALATARASAANLAHALKTPVATLALELAGDPRAGQVDRIDATIRHHLARARAQVASTRVATPLAPAIDVLIATIATLRSDRAITIGATVSPALIVGIDPADLDELVGNLIDNAVRHARTHVHIVAQPTDRRVALTIVDDGPGIPAAERDNATAPGVRLDERTDGHGFGLAIARDLTELHGGVLTLADGVDGGLAVSVTLPLARRH